MEMNIKQRRNYLLGLMALCLLGSHVQADWKDMLNQTIGGSSGSSIATAALSNSEVVAGLKEALGNGVETSIKTLGHRDGFLGNELVRIAMPDSLKSVEKLARAAGQGQVVDEFITTLNRAAEQAVPEAAGILGDAIREMSVTDAKSILGGPDDAATQYFRRHSESKLAKKFLPIVKQATDQAGVTSSYKSLMKQSGGGLLGGLMKSSSMDLDSYVTERTMDGLFKYIAIQERQIRENPAARTSDLLKKVFSSGH
jgi:hypothetical protein